MAEPGVGEGQPHKPVTTEEGQLKTPLNMDKLFAEIKAGVEAGKEEINKRKQVVVEFLNETEKDSKLGSPRFKAFCDYVDVEEQGGMGEPKTFKQALIQETIRQRRNGELEYDTQFGEVEKEEKKYESNFQGMRKINNIPQSFEEQLKIRTIAEWKSVKDDEIKKRNQQP